MPQGITLPHRLHFEKLWPKFVRNCVEVAIKSEEVEQIYLLLHRVLLHSRG
jgi:hypothetical protein